MSVVKTNIKDVEENFAKFDLALICEDRYKTLSDSDKILYTLLKNQEGLSINSVKNGNFKYVDSNGDIFVEISQVKLCKLLNKSEPTIRKGLNALEKAGLIERAKSGFQKCHKIYIGKTISTLTLGEYFKKISCEIEEENKNNDKKVTIKTTRVEDVIKKDDEDKKNTPKPKKEKTIKIDSDIVKAINESCVNIKKSDLSKCEEEFTDIKVLKEALSICEDNNSNGIKALRLAYKKLLNGDSGKAFKKNSFHNCKNTVTEKYTEDTLEAVLEGSQIDKYGVKETFQDKIEKSLVDEVYYNNLTNIVKKEIRNYILNDTNISLKPYWITEGK